jgi:error-prone DNA polymerase
LNQIVSRRGKRDLLEDLLVLGWSGLALASDDPEFLESLSRQERRGLYVKLTHGLPFSELLRFSRSSDLPTLAVNDALTAEGKDDWIGNLIRSISLSCAVEELPASERIQPHQHLVDPVEMEGYFSAVPEALAAAGRIAEQAESNTLLPGQYVFPRYRDLSESDSYRLLRRLCWQGAGKLYEKHPGRQRNSADLRSGSATSPLPLWKRRLDHELQVIRCKGFSGYFLVVRDIVRRCSRTCGRGSSAASLVSYLLGITHVDPLRHGLDFDRFLNYQRSDPPDIDVDFPWDERDSVLHYVFDSYPGCAGMVADHVTFGPRSAVRESAKAYGLPEREIGAMVKYYKYGEARRIPGFLLIAARVIQGLPRNLATHCGGVVITPGAITEYTHVQSSPSGFPVIAWDRDSAQGARLVKIDLLGNRSLAVLRDTIELVNRQTSGDSASPGTGRVGAAPPAPQLTWHGLDGMGNRETRRMISRGDTVGIFYVESPATRQLLRKMGRGDFEHLVMATSIIRPAANRAIRKFLPRLHGAPYHCLSPVLDQTYGLMIFQEDVSRVAMTAAGFSFGQANRLRKTLSGKNGSADLERYRKLFFSKGARRGTSVTDLVELWDMICSFEGYSFCKAHSASYALVSFKLAYLKRHFPLRFFLSVINNGGGYYSRQTYLNECRRSGVTILLPDVNKSEVAYTAEGDALRIGLGQLRGISRTFVGELLAERGRGGLFTGYADFLRRLHPGLLEFRVLVGSGALDGISEGMCRPQLLWRYCRNERIEGLFGQGIPAVPDYPEEVKLLGEIRTLGLMVSKHPVSIFRSRAERLSKRLRFPHLIRSLEIPRFVGRQVSLVGLVACGKEALTRTRELMVFISFEDEFSLYETVLFPSLFRSVCRRIDGGGLFLLSGVVEEEMGAVTVTVKRISRLF